MALYLRLFLREVINCAVQIIKLPRIIPIQIPIALLSVIASGAGYDITTNNNHYNARANLSNQSELQLRNLTANQVQAYKHSFIDH